MFDLLLATSKEMLNVLHGFIVVSTVEGRKREEGRGRGRGREKEKRETEMRMSRSLRVTIKFLFHLFS